MKFNHIKLSSRTTHLFGMIGTNTNLGHESLARLSLCLSIKQKGIPNPEEYNKNGGTFEPSKLFGTNENIYLALMINRLRHDKLDPTIHLDEMTTTHINRGAISLKQRLNDLVDVYDFEKEFKT